MPYADILQNVKADRELTGLGGSVSHVRRTWKRDLKLELNESSEKTADRFRGGKVLGEQAEVKSWKQKIVIECKGLDEVTSRKDICVALAEQLKLSEIKGSAIKRMKKAYGGTQTPIISFPMEQ